MRHLSCRENPPLMSDFSRRVPRQLIPVEMARHGTTILLPMSFYMSLSKTTR